jgi:hypothetical protein
MMSGFERSRAAPFPDICVGHKLVDSAAAGDDGEGGGGSCFRAGADRTFQDPTARAKVEAFPMMVTGGSEIPDARGDGGGVGSARVR